MPEPSPPISLRWALAACLGLFGLVWVVVVVRYAPPAPRAADAPREVFSAGRADEVLRALVGDGATRRAGTTGHARAQELLVATFRKLGWEVEIQRARACTYHGLCGPVANVVARLPGREPEIGAVLVSAHYDSVLAGPGAGDDGLGTAAIVEVARALTEGPLPRRSIVALLADAEESGLLGSEAFVAQHPLAKTIRATVNLDARGTRGPSQMFETSAGNDALVSLMARHLDRPVTTSLFYEVYKRMPNDTDFSLTKKIAVGLNFANTAGIEHYHTPLDNLANVDRGTLQHHGDHVLAMTRALADADPSSPTFVRGTTSDAVWFDVLALGVVHLPARLAIALAALAVVLLAVGAARRRAFDLGLVVFVAIVVPGLLAAYLVGIGLSGVGAFPALFVAHPTPAIVALSAASAAAMLAVGNVMAARATVTSLWTGVWLGFGVVGLGIAVIAPGASYLFVVPSFVAALAGLGLKVSGGARYLAVATVAPATVLAILVLALGAGVYDALGFAVTPLLALPTVLLGATLLPLVPALPPWLARRASYLLAASSLLAGAVALAAPKFTSDHPQRTNVVFRQEGGKARVFVDTSWGPASWGKIPAAMAAALGPVRPEHQRALPWSLPTSFADGEPIASAPPAAEIVSREARGAERRIVVRLRSLRGAPMVVLEVPRTSTRRRLEVRVEGRPAFFRRFASSSLLALDNLGPEGVLVEMVTEGAEPLEATLLDRTAGLPPGSKAEAVARARPSTAVPTQDGDVTILAAPLTL